MRFRVRFGPWKKTSLIRKDEKSSEWMDDMIVCVGSGSDDESHHARFQSYHHSTVPSICSLAEMRGEIVKPRKPRGQRHRWAEHIESISYLLFLLGSDSSEHCLFYSKKDVYEVLNVIAFPSASALRRHGLQRTTRIRIRCGSFWVYKEENFRDLSCLRKAPHSLISMGIRFGI